MKSTPAVTTVGRFNSDSIWSGRLDLRSIGASERLALVVAVALMVFRVPGVLAESAAGWLAISLLVLPIGSLCLWQMVARRDPAALVLLAVVGWTLLTAVTSGALAVTFFGTFNATSSGLQFIGAALAWSLGRRCHRSIVPLLGLVIVACAALSGTIAVLQLIFQPQTGAMRLVSGRPSGLGGHPVYFASHMLAAAGWFVGRAAQDHRVRYVVGFGCFAAFAALSGARFAVAGIGLLLVALWIVTRQRSTLQYIGASAFGIVAAQAAHALAGTKGGVADRAVSAGGAAHRSEIWRAGMRAWIDRPLTGWGEGRFSRAVETHLSAELIDGRVWADAHNLLVARLVAQGVVGLVLFIVFVVCAVRASRGPLAWAALGLSLGMLLEPTPPATFALAALVLGASASTAPPTLQPQVAAPRVVVVAAFFGFVLGVTGVLAHVELQRVMDDASIQTLPVTAQWLRHDPDSASAIADSRWAFVEAGNATAGDAIEWRRKAMRLDPEAAIYRSVLAGDLARAGDLSGAEQQAWQVLELQPNNLQALRVLRFVAIEKRDHELEAMADAAICAIRARECR